MNLKDKMNAQWQRGVLLMLLLLGGTAGLVKAQSLIADNRPVGYVYLEDNFDWVTAEAGGADYLNGKFENAGPRIDKMPAPFDEKLAEAGWKSSSQFVYFRIGYLQIGRRTDLGDIISPKLRSRSAKEPLKGYVCHGIEAGKKSDVEVSFDVAVYQGVKGNKDTDEVVVEVLNAGQFKDGSSEKTIKVRSWNQWKKMSFKVYDATSDTQFSIRSARSDKKGVASRFFMDNFKVVKIK